jgi:hypothetical protein
MKNNNRLAWSLTALTLMARALEPSAAATISADASLQPPAGNFLVLSNVTGEVRVLDSKGLVLEKHLTYLPRIPLADLSGDQLHALLETKTAYASLTAFGSSSGTNGQGVAVERELQEAWHQGPSLAGRIQTRLEILEDLRDYNNEIALLPGSLAAASQYAVNDIPINNRLTNRAATVVVAAAQVETAENYRAAGGADAPQAEQQAREVYQATAARMERANDVAMVANGQIAGANQAITNHLAKCAALAARLATHGINVSSVPPFSPVPPLALQAEVDAERKTH